MPRKYFLFAVWQIVGSEEQMPGRGRDCEIQGIKLPGLDEPRSQTHPETDRFHNKGTPSCRRLCDAKSVCLKRGPFDTRLRRWYSIGDVEKLGNALFDNVEAAVPEFGLAEIVTKR